MGNYESATLNREFDRKVPHNQKVTAKFLEDLQVSTDPHLIKDASTNCGKCGAALCIRKQTINLALGNVERMLCLPCMAKSEDSEPEKLISDTVGYIMGRDCFRKEWLRYASVADCPEPVTCFPETCFNGKLNGKV